MLTQKQVSLLPNIYDAAISADSWTDALNCFGLVTEAEGVALAAIDNTGLPFSISHTNEKYDENDLAEYFREVMEFEQASWSALNKFPNRTLVLDTDVWTDVSRHNERHDFLWYRKRGLYRRSGARLNDSGGWSDSVGLQYRIDRDDIPKSLILKTEAMLPHLAKAVELHRTFFILRSRFNAVLSALDHIVIGVCILTDNSEIQIANREARRIFQTKDGLYPTRDNRLSCSDDRLSNTIRSAVKRAASTVVGQDALAEVIVAVPKYSSHQAYLVEIAPLTENGEEYGEPIRGSIAFIVDPEQKRPFDIHTMKRLFHLTSAEAHVCRLLVEGLIDKEIAEIRNTAVATVRVQAKSVYKKIGVRRRADLIRAALSVSPPIDAPGPKNQ